MTYFTDIEVVYGMPAKDYFARPEVSRSDLVSLLKAPAKFPHNRANPATPTEPMIFGSMVHELLLEGLLPLRDACIVSPADCLTKKGVPSKTPKNTDVWKNLAVAAEALGKDIYMDYEAQAITDKVTTCTSCASVAFPHLLDACEKEVAIFATHADSGVRVKARLDLLHDSYVADLKTTKDASEDSVVRSVGNFRYDIQAAFYGDLGGAVAGLEHLPFLFACVETEAPYMTAEWDLSEEWVENGRADYERALELYKKYEAEGYPKTLGKGTLEPKPWQLGG